MKWRWAGFFATRYENPSLARLIHKSARPGADYQHSLELLQQFKAKSPGIPTKSGLMVGLGETDEEILEVMRDMRTHDIEMLTIGQYLQPSNGHLPVLRYVHPDVFKSWERAGLVMGFANVASGAMVRSSYHADRQALAAGSSRSDRHPPDITPAVKDAGAV